MGSYYSPRWPREWNHFTCGSGCPSGATDKATNPSNLPVPVLSFLSLVGSLRALSPDQRQATALHVLLNGFVGRAAWVDWLNHTVRDVVRVIDIDENCPAGNDQSYRYMMGRIYELRDPKAVMFLLEDDYLNHPEMLAEVVQLFASHNVCMVVPYDYMDRYTVSDNIDDGHIKVIAGVRRHWRTVESSTVTFVSRLQVMNAVKDKLPAPWDDRGRCRKLRKLGVEIWGPLPTLSTHFTLVAQTRWSAPILRIFSRRSLIIFSSSATSSSNHSLTPHHTWNGAP
eukprot:TRINITY_DN1884_c0_g1_i4.p1 TRINITY_DN1884_c0_g1~~TRINITY_DN1884_c0_g1_i4.p1  ORF type:complete len:283 (+),score=22.92 TRINITY_DN1884_c0_g1_i4:335-1183(+)